MMVRLASILLLGSIGIELFAHQAVGQTALPIACKLDQKLNKKLTGVEHRPTGFKVGNDYYPIEVFGLGQLNTAYNQKPYRMCFRYDVFNPGTKTIKSFRWPDAGIYEVDIPPGVHLKFRGAELQTRYERTDIAPTEIGAFKSARVTTESAFRIEDAVSKNRLGFIEGSVPFDSEKAFNRKSWADLTALGIRPEIVSAIPRPSKSFQLPPLQQSLELGKLSLSVSSTASYEVSEGVERVIIRFDIGRPKDARIFAPFVTAMSAYDEALRKVKTFDEANVLYAAAAAKVNDIPTISDNKLSYTFGSRKDFKEPALYVVDTPVTIIIGEIRACIKIRSYSPVPISGQEAFCRTNSTLR